MSWHYLTKEFYDYADDIEGVNIHYIWTPIGGVPDWENQRVTRFMPLVQLPIPTGSEKDRGTVKNAASSVSRLRRKILKLPREVIDPQSGIATNRYLLHHYFEIFQDGHRHYSPLYTEELHTREVTASATPDSTSSAATTTPHSITSALVKK